MAALAVSLCSAAAAHAQPPSPQKVLRLSMETAETGFDPAQLSDLYSRSIVREIFDAPLRFAYLGKIGSMEPATAARMPDHSDDFRTFTFEIKPGIFFQDDPAFEGKPRELVAADYVYSIKRYADPRWKAPGWSTIESWAITGLRDLREASLKTGRFDYDRAIPGLQVLDRHRFRIQLDRPSPRLPEAFADPSSLGAVAREVVEHYGDAIAAHPVGTGPFRLIEWRRSSRIVLERNPGYREDIYSVVADPSDAEAVRLAALLQGKRLPAIDRVEVDIITEPQPRWLAFLNGAQDIIERMPLTLSPLALPNGKPSATLLARHIRIERAPQLDVTLLSFNMDDPVIGGYTPERVALRRAISLAYDTDETIRSSYKGQAFAAQTPIVPMTTGYDAAVTSEMGKTDPNRANALLDTYGWLDRDGDGWREQPDGTPLVITYANQPDQAARILDEIMKKSFDRIHVRLAFSIAPFSENIRKARNGQFQMWGSGSLASAPDSAGIFERGYSEAIGGSNLSRFRSKQFDALYIRQQSLADGPERTAVLTDMSRILIAWAPMNFVAHRYAIDLTYPRLTGYRRWPFVSDWWRYVDIDTTAQNSR
ncbi:ABC transporter substrate-binding protein [soil metagenome]